MGYETTSMRQYSYYRYNATTEEDDDDDDDDDGDDDDDQFFSHRQKNYIDIKQKHVEQNKI